VTGSLFTSNPFNLTFTEVFDVWPGNAGTDYNPVDCGGGIWLYPPPNGWGRNGQDKDEEDEEKEKKEISEA